MLTKQYLIKETSDGCFDVLFSEKIASFLQDMPDTEYDVLVNKLRQCISKATFKKFPACKLDSLGVSFGPICRGLDVNNDEVIKIINRTLKKIVKEIYSYAEDIGVDINMDVRTKTLVHGFEPYSPQAFLCAMTRKCYFLKEEDTVREINNILLQNHIKPIFFDFKDIRSVVENDKKVVLVNCSGFYGTNNIREKFVWYQIEGTPFDESEI